jgi:hypothetical protein|mmetsp:Transcript_64783/g.107447  ORF Transcript_64783/g.107447 Transcript_64783/m.107447 type:complete len:88 (+) Transcript_64783:906-1169(+)
MCDAIHQVEDTFSSSAFQSRFGVVCKYVSADPCVGIEIFNPWSCVPDCFMESDKLWMHNAEEAWLWGLCIPGFWVREAQQRFHKISA